MTTKQGKETPKGQMVPFSRGHLRGGDPGSGHEGEAGGRQQTSSSIDCRAGRASATSHLRGKRCYPTKTKSERERYLRDMKGKEREREIGRGEQKKEEMEREREEKRRESQRESEREREEEMRHIYIYI